MRKNYQFVLFQKMYIINNFVIIKRKNVTYIMAIIHRLRKKYMRNCVNEKVSTEQLLMEVMFKE